jgi:hypothetical protein
MGADADGRQSGGPKAAVFICCSRKNMAFVDRLDLALKKHAGTQSDRLLT